MYVYILQLEDDCYYVGKTNFWNKRYQEHFNGAGSVWTHLHKPVKVLETITTGSDFDEDKYTKEYMLKYGINKVRGGSYVKSVLDSNQIKHLQKELWGAQNLCFQCGGEHFINACPSQTVQKSAKHISNQPLVDYMWREYERLNREHYKSAYAWLRAINTIYDSEYEISIHLSELEGDKFPYIGPKFSNLIREFYSKEIVDRKKIAQDLVNRINSDRLRITISKSGDMIDLHAPIDNSDKELLRNYKAQVLEILSVPKPKNRLISAIKAGVNAFKQGGNGGYAER
jgi:predicted GIY-YIG superfamily endonuclease